MMVALNFGATVIREVSLFFRLILRVALGPEKSCTLGFAFCISLTGWLVEGYGNF